ncbi:MAG: TRAP transporter large permease [Candidatus Methylomirabilales bacterium]
MAALILVLMLLFFATGMPVAFAMAASSLAYMLAQGGLALISIPQRMLNGADNFPLLAIPFFMLAGSLMNTGGVTRRLVDFSSALVGHITGGLAHVVVVANMIMAGMSGSAVADATGTGSILVPSMRQKGYPADFAAAIVGAAATIGPIIPPSIPMVIFASIAEVSTARLFVGGVVPGVLMGLYLMLVAYLVARRRGYGRERRRTLREVGLAFGHAIPPLFCPVIIMGGILGGIFTPTEAAVVASVYAFGLGAWWYRELRWRDLPRILEEVVVRSAVVLFIVAASSLMAWLLALERVPQQLMSGFLAISTNPWVILAIINVFLLILGMLMDSIPILIILVPVLAPLILKIGVDPIHFGVVMVLNLMIGLLTPPVGMVMYVVCSLSGVAIRDFVRECWPMITALILVLAMITFYPPLVVWLPNALLGK